MVVERKYERDIDIMLAEEFSASPIFAAWFLSHTRFAGVNATVAEVFVSRSDNDGETDLAVLYADTANARRFAVLIENKIDAPFQPNQEARYHLRAINDMAYRHYDEYEVVLCAPQAYRDRRNGADAFRQFVSYEAIGTVLAQEPGARAAYRASFIRSAADRRTSGWSRIDDATTNDFWDAAYELATHEFPILELRRLNVSRAVTWISIRPQDMPTRPQNVYINLKGDRGFVDLTFGNELVARLRQRFENLIDPDMTLHQTGGSSTIRLLTAGFLVTEPWTVAGPKIAAAFNAAARLVVFYRTHRAVLSANIASTQ